METSLKPGFVQIFSCCPKNLSCPKFGGAAVPLAPRPRPYAYGAPNDFFPRKTIVLTKKQILPRNFWSSRKAKNFLTTFSTNGFRRLCFPHFVTTILLLLLEKKVSWKFRNKEKLYFGNIRSLGTRAFGMRRIITNSSQKKGHNRNIVKAL